MKTKVILRIIVSPFVLVIILMKYNYHAFRNTFCFLRYGGEWVTYAVDDSKTIYDIYNELKTKKIGNEKASGQ